MKRLQWCLSRLLWIGGLAVAPAALAIASTLPKPFTVLPQPQQVEVGAGVGLDPAQLRRFHAGTTNVRPMPGGFLARLPQADGAGPGTVSLQLVSGAPAPASPEGYVLTIADHAVRIVARGEAGLFYGCQTLEQLLEDATEAGVAVPALTITDQPALSYRAVHFDVKHHLDTMDYYYRSIDRLARYKINAVIFEFEDKLRYRRQPLVGAPQAISIDEMAALTRYARERHVEISPLVQGLGHATFILKHQAYAHLRELPHNRWAFCPLHEGGYQVLFDLYRDAIEATPGSRYLHVGGDEIGNIGLCPRCKPTADAKGVFGLNLYWLNRVSEFAAAHGRIPIFWDDMPLKFAGVHDSVYGRTDLSEEYAAAQWAKGTPVLDGLLDQFPKNCVYMRWSYGMARQPGNRMALNWYRERGLQAMIATAAQSGQAAVLPYDDAGTDQNHRGVVAIRSFIQLAAEQGIDGMLCTAWDDKSPHMETYWRGFLASAEFSWSPTQRSLTEFDAAYFQREYGPATASHTAIYGELRRAVEFWTAALSPKGTRLDDSNVLSGFDLLAHWLPPEKAEARKQIDYAARVLDTPDPASPGDWSRKHAERLVRARQEMARYERTSRELKEITAKTIRNRFHWEVMAATNDFQITAATLLVALESADTADLAARKAGLSGVEAALARFDGAWKQLQEVYGRTRFISNPENYVKDRYGHFASQREDLSFLIQAEEVFHGKVRDWLAHSR